MAGLDQPISLKYFDLKGHGGLCGLGGGIRFFFYTQGIQFSDETVVLDEWKAGLKQEAMKSGQTITGHLPIVRFGGRSYIESNAALRLASRRLGLYGTDAEADYCVDMAADIIVEARSAWHDAAVAGPEAREAYCSAPDKRKHQYQVLNALIAQSKGQGPHVIGSSSTFVDAVLFAMLWDDVVLFKGDEYLWTANPHLELFFKSYLQQPKVAEWCRSMRPDLVEGSAS
ncbi:hypothetical protein OEZ86_005729 [Tetradesmus obliquus]|nr:hypothetical protein OEZ86_005729 [Tetradesmus obliquus]